MALTSRQRRVDSGKTITSHLLGLYTSLHLSQVSIISILDMLVGANSINLAGNNDAHATYSICQFTLQFTGRPRLEFSFSLRTSILRSCHTRNNISSWKKVHKLWGICRDSIHFLGKPYTVSYEFSLQFSNNTGDFLVILDLMLQFPSFFFFRKTC